MSQLVLFIGLPASGKSSFYRHKFADTHQLISKDLLKNNKRKDRRQRQLMEEAFQVGQSIVLDNTHPSRADRSPWIHWAKDKSWSVSGYYLSASLAQCKERNARRDAKSRVPDVGFHSILGKLERPSLDEGFDELYFVTAKDGQFQVESWRED